MKLKSLMVLLCILLWVRENYAGNDDARFYYPGKGLFTHTADILKNNTSDPLTWNVAACGAAMGELTRHMVGNGSLRYANPGVSPVLNGAAWTTLIAGICTEIGSTVPSDYQEQSKLKMISDELTGFAFASWALRAATKPRLLQVLAFGSLAISNFIKAYQAKLSL